MQSHTAYWITSFIKQKKEITETKLHKKKKKKLLYDHPCLHIIDAYWVIRNMAHPLSGRYDYQEKEQYTVRVKCFTKKRGDDLNTLAPGKIIIIEKCLIWTLQENCKTGHWKWWLSQHLYTHFPLYIYITLKLKCW